MPLSFDIAFEALTGWPPFRWQRRLYERFVSGSVPDALDLPTGLGKTSVIPIWLLARAQNPSLPRRLVYVVDRRAVVDQATEIAEQLRCRIESDKVLAPLSEALGLADKVLPVSTLRGQFADNRRWLENPAYPAVIVGTVDMIGSRLLFEGYGVSRRMRPVHAALLGADALIVLDEAHLVPPFEALVRRIAVDSRSRPAPVPGLQLVSLSATGRDHEGSVFRLEAADAEDERVMARLNASKWLKLEDVETGKLVEALAARALSRGESRQQVVIFCNSRKVAQAVESKLASGKGAEPRTALLVGARRGFERDELRDHAVFRRFLAGGAELEVLEDAGPAFLVATSAGEVGVDLDADHLVCDLVPWERMVQRLGRVNRRAKPGCALVDVLAAVPDKEAEDAADAEQIRRWRAPFESRSWEADEDGRREGSPSTLLRLRADPEMQSLFAQASTPPPLHPALTAPLVDAWAMTSLPAHPGRPFVEPWLRGWIEKRPQTRIVWRQHLPLRQGEHRDESKRALTDFFEGAAPHPAEILETETYEAAEWLKTRCQVLIKAGREEDEVAAVLLTAQGEVEGVRTLGELATAKKERRGMWLSDRTLVAQTRIAGLSPTGLLDPKESEPPSTLDGDTRGWGDEVLQRIGFRVREVDIHADEEGDWPVQYRRRISADPDEEEEDGREWRVEVWRGAGPTKGDAAIARFNQALALHHQWTGDEARKLADALRIPPGYAAALILAAEAHDAGKARELWQRAMRAPVKGRPFAKTRGGGVPALLQVEGKSYRHEFGSLRNAQCDAKIGALVEELRDLALHLIAAHHGFARPLITPVDPDAPSAASAELAQEAALRFIRLQERWGPWGLAWWEAVLRAADWMASRRNNEQALADG